MEKIYLGIGTNLGKKVKNLEEALAGIEEYIGNLVLTSSIYETEPWGFRSKSTFLNMVAEVDTNLDPPELLKNLLMIESLLGRKRDGTEYASRIMDLDILLYNDQEVVKDRLVIPHPLMHERKFVLIPLCEIAPGLIHPVLKKSIKELLDECRDRNKVTIYNKPLSAKL